MERQSRLLSDTGFQGSLPAVQITEGLWKLRGHSGSQSGEETLHFGQCWHSSGNFRGLWEPIWKGRRESSHFGQLQGTSANFGTLRLEPRAVREIQAVLGPPWARLGDQRTIREGQQMASWPASLGDCKIRSDPFWVTQEVRGKNGEAVQPTSQKLPSYPLSVRQGKAASSASQEIVLLPC